MTANEDQPTMCHVCRYVRPMRLMKVDESTRTLFHDPSCPLPGGLMVCDAVPCGSTEGATARVARGAVVVPVEP
jgi:hypothetical protein